FSGRMALTPGTRLGPYEILSPLGAGGMGEVYKARDTRLDRIVAVKVLPSKFSQSTELRQRFEREARAISQLTHPHICTLHDVGREGETEFLVMEFLEGETLAKRLVKGPIPIDLLPRYGTEIAEALENAHRHGIVHRDLKPSNVMLTKQGVKLLDFGLARLKPPAGPAFDRLSALPTEGKPFTQEGTILGTLHHMAPEQLEGQEADARTDIFAFGTVLYEMATGEKAFSGRSQASLIAAILDSEPPPIGTLRPMTPPALDHVIRTCLAKDPDDRWQTAHDVRLELKWVAEGGSQAGITAPVAARRRIGDRVAWASFALAALAAAFFAFAYIQRRPRPEHGLRAMLPFPEKRILGQFALSPDGTRLAFTASRPGSRLGLWIRGLDGTSAEPVAGAEDAVLPFWSPDGGFVGFFSSDRLKRV